MSNPKNPKSDPKLTRKASAIKVATKYLREASCRCRKPCGGDCASCAGNCSCEAKK